MEMKDYIAWTTFQAEVSDHMGIAGRQQIANAYIRGVPSRKMTSDEVLDYLKRQCSSIPIASFAIKKVIFNPPATIVLWEDGQKTVVKIQNNETYDPEKGLAMAIAKRALGNEGNYFNHIKKWTDKHYEDLK